MAIPVTGLFGQTGPDEAFRLGEWTVEPALLRLSRGARSVQLGPKVMGVLVHLARRPGRPVSREELLDAVWPDVVVVEGVLTRAISQLRQAFGDDAKHPRYIETIRASGYRLIAEVLPAGTGIDSPSAEGPVSTAAAAGQRFLPLLLAAAAALALVSVTAVILATRSASTPAAAAARALRPVPATSWPGLELDGALSPDGEQIAFAWQEGGQVNPDIYVKTLRGDNAVRLTETDCAERRPVWSPDGSRIAFVRIWPDEPNVIVVMPAAGGHEKVLATRARLPANLDWSPDGRFLAFSDLVTDEGPAAIFLHEIATGTRRQVTWPVEAFHFDYNPSFSPDGLEISFERQVGRADRDVYAVSLASGDERRLTHDGTIVAGHAWDPRGRGIVMASMRSGDWRLWRLAQDGSEPQLLSLGAGKVRGPNFARDLPRLAFEKRRVTTELWQMPLATAPPLRPAANISAGLEKWIVTTGYNHELHFSHDGTRIAFISDRSGSDQVWLADADGSRPTQQTSFDARFVASPRWSPDDRTIALVASPDGNTDLYLLDVASGAITRLTEDPADDRTPSWSADGRTIYFASERTGTWEAFELPAAGGAVRRLSEGGGYVPQPAPDGRSLYFLHGERRGIWRLPLDGGEPEQIVEALTPCDWGGWTIARNALYYVTRRGGGIRVVRRDLDTGHESTAWHDPDLPQGTLPCKMRTLSVAPDESRLALSFVGAWESDILWIDLP